MKKKVMRLATGISRGEAWGSVSKPLSNAGMSVDSFFGRDSVNASNGLIGYREVARGGLSYGRCKGSCHVHSS